MPGGCGKPKASQGHEPAIWGWYIYHASNYFGDGLHFGLPHYEVIASGVDKVTWPWVPRCAMAWCVQSITVSLIDREEDARPHKSMLWLWHGRIAKPTSKHNGKAMSVIILCSQGCPRTNYLPVHSQSSGNTLATGASSHSTLWGKGGQWGPQGWCPQRHWKCGVCSTLMPMALARERNSIIKCPCCTPPVSISGRPEILWTEVKKEVPTYCNPEAYPGAYLSQKDLNRELNQFTTFLARSSLSIFVWDCH